jgi:hypothetical protein
MVNAVNSDASVSVDFHVLMVLLPSGAECRPLEATRQTLPATGIIG